MASPQVLVRTLAASGPTYATQFIGELGWLDVPMPPAYRVAAWLLLVWAALAVLLAGRSGMDWRHVAVCLGCVAAAGLGTFVMQYLTWSHVDAALIDGVQGRYFLPLAVLLAVPLARNMAGRLGWIAWPVLLVPVIRMVVMVHQIVCGIIFRVSRVC